MRSTFRNLIGVCIAALGFCFSGFGFAAESHQVVNALRYVVAEVGSYGAESAKCKAELAHMASIDSERTMQFSGLTRESNGYRLTSMVTATHSGVAKGKVGVGALALT